MVFKMLKLLIRLGLVLLVLNIFVTSCAGFRNRGGGYGSKYESRGYEEPARMKSSVSGTSALASSSTRRGLGLSAWGIVTLIVSIILAIAGMYYFSICYPILCKKSRKYDMMGLPPPV